MIGKHRFRYGITLETDFTKLYDIKHDFETLADDFYIWYHSLKFEDLNETCKKEIRNIQEKNHEFENKFKNLLRK